MDSIAGKISESPARKSRIHIQLEETCSNGNKYVELSDMSRAYSAAISPIHPLFLRQNLPPDMAHPFPSHLHGWLPTGGFRVSTEDCCRATLHGLMSCG